MKWCQKKVILFFALCPFILFASNNQFDSFQNNKSKNKLFQILDLDQMDNILTDENDEDINEYDNEDYFFPDIPLDAIFDEDLLENIAAFSKKIAGNCFKILGLGLYFSYTYYTFCTHIMQNENHL